MMNNGIFPIVLFALSFFGALGANADVALGTAVRGRGGVVFTVPPQSRTVWADVEWVVGGETNTAWRHLHLFGDGEERRYFFDGATAVRWGANYPDRSIADKWNGAITSFRVLNNKTKEEVPIRDMRIVTDNPGLPPELILSHAKMPMQLDRAGRPVDIEVGVFNVGTVAATGVTVRVEGLPKGVRVVIGARNAPPCPSGASPLSEGGKTGDVTPGHIPLKGDNDGDKPLIDKGAQSAPSDLPPSERGVAQSAGGSTPCGTVADKMRPAPKAPKSR